MDTLLALVTLGMICTTVCALDCKECHHQSFDIADTDEAEFRSEEVDMWNQSCMAKADDKMDTITCTEDVNATDTKTVCFSMTVEADEYTYTSNRTGNLTEATFKVNLYMRGCLNVSDDTDNGKVDDITTYRSQILADLPADNEGSYSTLKGTLEICDQSAGCNKDKLDPVAGSAHLVASLALMFAGMAVATLARH